MSVRPAMPRMIWVMKKPWVLSYPLSAQRKFWSDWADAKAGLSLRWTHTHFVVFVMSRLNYNETINRGSYTSGHFIWNLWNEPSASFINFIWNDHECKILLFIWLFEMCFIALKVYIISIENITLSPMASWHFAPVTKCYVTCDHTIFMTWR